MSPPLPMLCSNEECSYETPTGIQTYELVLKALDLHTQAVHRKSTGSTQTVAVKTERPKRPSLSVGLSESDWAFFVTRWRRYVRQTDIIDQQLLDELWSCMDNELEKLAFGDSVEFKTEDELLSKIKNLSVTTLHPALHAVTLHQMKQESNETSKAYSTRVRATAYNCNLEKTCTSTTCLENISFVEETCYHIILAGLYDADMRDRALTQAMLGNIKDLPTLLNFTSAEESAKQSTPQVSAIARNRKNGHKTQFKCNHCGLSQHGEYNRDRQSQCKAYGTTCQKCRKMNHLASVCKSKRPAVRDSIQTAAIEEEDIDDPEVAGFLAALVSVTQIANPSQAAPVVKKIRSAMSHNVNALPVPHHSYDIESKQWKQKSPNPSPTITVSVQVDRKAYKELNLNPPRLVKKNSAGHARARKATADTGAQLTVVNVRELMALGIKKDSIFPLATTVNTVTKASVDLLGGVFVVISSYDPRTQAVRRTRQLAYVSTSVPGIYLSNEACIDLGCVPKEFPLIGQCDALTEQPKIPKKCSNSGVNSSKCACPKRQLPPTDAPVLPCDPTEKNLPILREYILERFSSSAFNCCEQQPLPLMAGSPPLRLFVDPEASPTAIATPAKIPLHWDKQVKDGLDRDEALGVIEKVPVNEPVKWCSRMLVTPKHDGTPRRVIDYSQLNKHAPRQTHHTKSPYQIAASIPGGKVKTVLDNWHGYHSVPIDPADRPLTTFLTPYGRYRYKTTPQGLISAGDGYTQRMDLITNGTNDYESCVDDTILWDNTVQENFYRVCDFIAKCAKAGCIFNPNKFQFASETVDFLGFRITSTGVQPHPDFLQTIMSFPTPKSITDVRSWFGLINQVNYAFAAAPVMEPFKKLLSSKVPFHWSAELNESFEKSKLEVIRQCENGVRSFQLNTPTVLATDWSKAAVGCWLAQKQCKCPTELPNCCPQGWQTVFATSKFNSPAVARYHPIEGEAYAAAWALERCRLFTLGHPKLTLAVDHRPLLAILGPNHDLGDLLNPRLMNFKLKTMAYTFTPAHIPGKQHVVPDTLSRRNDSPVLLSPKPPKMAPEDSLVGPGYSESFGPPSWISSPQVSSLQSNDDSSQTTEAEDLYLAQAQVTLAEVTGYLPSVEHSVITWNSLCEACNSDTEYRALHKAVTDQFPTDISDCAEIIRPYYKLRQEFTSLGPVVMLQNKIVIPRNLRLQVLSHLHASHAGVNVMLKRASQSMYWPGYTQDIRNYQSRCKSCRYNAPSNPSEPPNPEPDLPLYPFHTICADFFSHEGKTYLTVVDKYSNWINVMKLQKDDSRNLIMALRQYFTVYGVCEVLATDGATVFTLRKFDKFCKLWGVKQRISSAYFAQSNKRAEVAVKSAKRIIMDNLSPTGSLETDKFARAILLHRNSPDPETGISPAEIVFGRPVRDHLPRPSYKPRAEWTELATRREEAYVHRHFRKCENFNKKVFKLKPLLAGQAVYIQNQVGPNPNKWGKSGTVVEVLPHSSYMVKIDGSNKVTKRNRRFLRAFTPFISKDVKDQAVDLAGLSTNGSSNDHQAWGLDMSCLCAVYDAPLAFLDYARTNRDHAFHQK